MRHAYITGSHRVVVWCLQLSALHYSSMKDADYCDGLQDGSMVVHGGYDGQNTFADTYILTTSDWTWRQVVPTGKASLHTHTYMQHAMLCPSSGQMKANSQG